MYFFTLHKKDIHCKENAMLICRSHMSYHNVVNWSCLFLIYITTISESQHLDQNSCVAIFDP